MRLGGVLPIVCPYVPHHNIDVQVLDHTRRSSRD
jgi:hypothetical protein